MRALVVFTESSVHPLSFLLKAGFEHCFVVVLSNGNWIRLDGTTGIPEIDYLIGEDFDLAGYFEDQGYRVIETEQNIVPTRTPVILNNCTGLVKAILCIRAPFVITPWRLYLYLRRNP